MDDEKITSLASLMYESYCKHLSEVSTTETKFPSWEDLTGPTRGAWRLAAITVRKEILSIAMRQIAGRLFEGIM